MSELVRVFESLIAETGGGRPVALCTIVATRGSTPQRAGAAMLVRTNYSTVGTLGGGCVEAEVRKRAFELMTRQASGVLDFVLDHDYGWDDGLICGGRMSVGVAPIGPGADVSQFQNALSALEARRPAHVMLNVDGGGRTVEYRLHLEVPPRLLIAGAGHVGLHLARLAADLDFDVTVFDDRPDCASPLRFPPLVTLCVGDIAEKLRGSDVDADTYVVIVTRGHQHDHQALDAVVRRPAGYIGLIGSKRKAKLIFDDLRRDGVSEEQLARVHTPVGLAIGAQLVPEIAVSIAAELIQTRRSSLPSLVEGPFARGG